VLKVVGQLAVPGRSVAFDSRGFRAIFGAMAAASPIPYTVSGIHPDTRKFHGESCATPQEAERRAKELREAGYQSVTIAPSDPKGPSWPKD